MEYIPAENYEIYRQMMEGIILPYLDERRTSGWLETLPGQKLYYEHFTCDRPKGVIVLQHGFTEHIEKYREMVYQYLKEGYHVWMLQQREHGESCRSCDNKDRINVLDYRRLISDLHAFYQKVVLKAEKDKGLPKYLIGHSMGGGVAACYAENYPLDFDKVVLLSPMLEVLSPFPVWAGKLLANVMIAAGRGAEAIPGSRPFRGVNNFEHDNADSRARYDYWFSRQLADEKKQAMVCTYNTAREFIRLTESACKAANCHRVQVPVLLFQAGADAMVAAGGQNTFLKHIGDKGQKIVFDGARHEIYMGTDEMQQRLYTEIFRFLNG